MLRGERVVLRPAAEADVEPLAAILAEPEVRAWWGAYDAARVRRELAEIPTWAIEVDGVVGGWLHANEEAEPDYPSVAFDVLVSERVRGGGYGREALRVAIAWFAVARGHHRFTIDPAVENERAVRAYEAVGFRRVGVLRRYERGPDGRWRDGLLMELVVEAGPA
ncbi:MAG: GNAT family N-acetyltransferase [Actinobacteria bacterium]|nr:GNAT family N-acetyltransferase [Actinomycetota bacterium]